MTAAVAPGAPALPAGISPNSLLAGLTTQPRVQAFLARAVSSGRVGQAYLFLGAPGSGKLDAAWALAEAILCDRGSDDGREGSAEGHGGTEGIARGCGACDACIRVRRRTHPDVHLYQPESATGYLIGQTRELLSDVALAPIRGRAKVYIIDRAEQLHANTANALLKTLEEPPAGVTFVLLGTSADVILPTIVSRCQCVPFRTVSPVEAARAVELATGAPAERCRMAVAVTGSPARGIEFVKSAARQDVRRAVLRSLAALPTADEADVLACVPDDIGQAISAVTGTNPLAKAAKKKDSYGEAGPTEASRTISAAADYLSRGARKQLEDRDKREVTARNRSAIMEALACARSLLRDVLLRLEDVGERPVNADAADTIERLCASATTAGAARALDAVARAEERIARNVTPQLAIEVMLLDIRKALICR